MDLKKFLKRKMNKCLLLPVGLAGFKAEAFGMSYYRVTGFYYVYQPIDGDRLIVECLWWNSTHIGGAGVAGTILPYDEVTFTGWKFRRWRLFKRWLYKLIRTKAEYRRFDDRINRNRYKFLKSLPKGMTTEAISEIGIKRAVDRAMKKFKS
jgi:hypothetical protein